MSTVRINELARELEVKSKEILDALTAVGVTEKKTHSSSIETDEAERVRTHILKGRGGSGSAAAARHEAEDKPKIDWSKVHSVGDVARAILEKKQQEAHPAPPRAATPAAAPVKAAPQPTATMSAAAAKPVASAVPATVPPAAPPASEAKPAPRKIVPQVRQAPNIVIAPPRPTPPQTPAIASKAPSGPVVVKPPIAAAAGPGTSAVTEAKPTVPTGAVVAARPAAAQAASSPTPAAVPGPVIAAAAQGTGSVGSGSANGCANRRG